jgi:hypothetical protein
VFEKKRGKKMIAMKITKDWTDQCQSCAKYFHNGEHVFNCDDDDYYDLICSECKNKYCTEEECPDFKDCPGCKDILVLNKDEWDKIPAVSVCGVKEIEEKI